MAVVFVGENVINKNQEIGTITAFDGRFITVGFQGRTAMFGGDAFLLGYLRYENPDLQTKAFEQIEADIEASCKEEERIAAKKAKPAQKAPVCGESVKIESTVLLIDPAPVYLNSVAKDDRQPVREIFDECEKDTAALYASFQPKMTYPKMTSRSRSKYCVGFLSKYLGFYVFRVFSRNDVYKKRVRTGITVMERNTAEILRVVAVNGHVYYFTKNVAFSDGYYNNTIGFPKWRGSDMGARVFLNEVICNCDCGYLNGYVADPKIHVEAFLFVDLLFAALGNNKAEIVFKNKAFVSTYRIDNIVDYLAEFTSKQIDFASKNDVLHALPFIKKYGVSDLDVLHGLEGVVRQKRGDSVYARLKWRISWLGEECPDLDQRLIHFIKKVDHFDAAMYNDYLYELGYRPGLTLQDLFDKDYIERHEAMYNERMARWEQNALEISKKEQEDYSKAIKGLSWIDREDNGYYIMVPKTLTDFQAEGNLQHNCVYKLRYYNRVINQESIIVFLRQEKDKPYVTIEFDYNTFEVLQALGKYNRRIEPELYRHIVDLGKQLYYEMHTQQ